MLNKVRVDQRLLTGVLAGTVLFLAACSVERESAIASMDKAGDDTSLFGKIWQIEDIDNRGIIDQTPITMEIFQEGRISGSTGCNQYFGSVNLGTAALQVVNIGSTRKACVPAIMDQEQRFLEALEDVRRYQTDGEFLRLYDELDNQRLRMIRCLLVDGVEYQCLHEE